MRDKVEPVQATHEVDRDRKDLNGVVVAERRAGTDRRRRGLEAPFGVAGAVLNGLTFVLFGAILLGPALGELSWKLALYAVLSLTVVRMMPVAVAMLGSRARLPTLGFLGWFGPRGLASIVFAVIVIEESQLPHEHLIVTAIYLTVGLSVFAHGFTAAPLANRYADWFERHPRDKAPPMESAPTEVTRTRRLLHESTSQPI